jgi:hypothetical protein
MMQRGLTPAARACRCRRHSSLPPASGNAAASKGRRRCARARHRGAVSNTGANSIPVLTNAAADAQGRISYRMAVVNNGLVTKTFQKSAFLSDDY